MGVLRKLEKTASARIHALALAHPLTTALTEKASGVRRLVTASFQAFAFSQVLMAAL